MRKLKNTNYMYYGMMAASKAMHLHASFTSLCAQQSELGMQVARCRLLANSSQPVTREFRSLGVA